MPVTEQSNGIHRRGLEGIRRSKPDFSEISVVADYVRALSGQRG